MHRGRRLLRAALVAIAIIALLVPAASAAPDAGSRRTGRSLEHRGRVSAVSGAAYAAEHERPMAAHVPNHRLASREPVSAPRSNAPRRLAPAVPAPVAVGGFDGLGSDDTLPLEPPDPWVATNGTVLVQSVNGMVRMTSRTGAELLRLPTWALFGLTPSENDADPRIIWDYVHGRWLGVVLSFPDDESDNYLNLAISATSDPLGAWDIWSIPYGSNVPDFPSLSSSRHLIALTANEYSGLTPLGSSVIALRWAEILAGRPPVIQVWTDPDPYKSLMRVAINVSASEDIHIIAADGANLPVYGVLQQDLPDSIAWGSAGTSFDPSSRFAEATLAPRQPGSPPTIVDADDGRPRDAVWRAGHLWYASTVAVSDDGGATFVDRIRVTHITTGNGNATLVDNSWVGAPGLDAFMPGIGLSTNGTVFVTYSESSPVQPVRAQAVARISPADWSTPITIAESAASYAGERWGDFSGVALDPVGTAAVWTGAEVVNEDGDWTTRITRLVLDTTAPVVTAPLVTVVTSGLSSTVPIRVTWSGSDTGSGVTGYRIEQKRAGATDWETIAGQTTATSTTRAILPGLSHQYRIQATDAYGNPSAYGTSPIATAAVVEQTTSTAYSGTWATSTSGVYSGGSARWASRAGASATLTFTGRAVAWVSPRSGGRGSARVYLDGVYKGTVSLYAASTTYRRIVWASPALVYGSHKLKVVVVGTSGRPRVDVDAFVVLR